jgi:hypothetical protein
MPDWIKALLILAVVAIVGLLLLGWIARKAFAVGARAGRFTITALATGGVSVLWPGADEGIEITKVQGERTRGAIILDALASGGVSLLTEPPRDSNSRRPTGAA